MTSLSIYYGLLEFILNNGLEQEGKKGPSQFALNQVLSLNVVDLKLLFTQHRNIAKKKLRLELELFNEGEVRVEEYSKVGATWWEDYKTSILINSYPTYFEKLPGLIEQINEQIEVGKCSKNNVLFIGETMAENTTQQPCLSLIHFHIIKNKEGNLELYVSVTQRSADCNLGLPNDIYQVYLITNRINAPLKNITWFINNAHIYNSNIEETKRMIKHMKEHKEMQPGQFKFALANENTL